MDILEHSDDLEPMLRESVILKDEHVSQETEIKQQFDYYLDSRAVPSNWLSLDSIEKESKWTLVLGAASMICVSAAIGLSDRWPLEGWIFVVMCTTSSAGFAWLDGRLMRSSRHRSHCGTPLQDK